MASEMMILPEVAELLEAEARRINAPEFVAADGAVSTSVLSVARH